MGEYAQGTIRRGILMGLNRVFIIEKSARDEFIRKDPRSEEILKPLIVGDDIRKYEINNQSKFLIWTFSGIDIEKYPAIKEYLDSFKEDLEKRWDKGNYYYELRACDYYDEIKKSKIIYPVIAKESQFSADMEGEFFLNDKCFLSLGKTHFY